MHVSDESSKIDVDWSWVAENATGDVSQLRLKYAGDDRKMFEIIQIECRQRCRRKLAETLAESPDFIFDSTIAGEQSTSDMLASYHASLIAPGCRVLDMTGGLGIDARHLALRASHVTMVELNPMRAGCAEVNMRAFGLQNVEVINGDSIEFLKGLAPDSFDVIFIDPARRGGDGRRLFALADCAPDVTAILEDILRVAKVVIIKASPMLDVTRVCGELHSVERVISLGNRSECKELDIVCRRGYDGDTLLSAVTLLDGAGSIEFKVKDAEGVRTDYSTPQAGGFLYEPFPSLAKLQADAAICKAFGVAQIAPNTHLYCSEAICPDFPGEILAIEAVEKFNKRSIRDISSRYPELDVTVKNFPLSASELTKRMKLRPSGHKRLIGCRACDGENILIIVSRVTR